MSLSLSLSLSLLFFACPHSLCGLCDDSSTALLDHLRDPARGNVVCMDIPASVRLEYALAAAAYDPTSTRPFRHTHSFHFSFPLTSTSKDSNSTSHAYICANASMKSRSDMPQNAQVVAISIAIASSISRSFACGCACVSRACGLSFVDRDRLILSHRTIRNLDLYVADSYLTDDARSSTRLVCLWPAHSSEKQTRHGGRATGEGRGWVGGTQTGVE